MACATRSGSGRAQFECPACGGERYSGRHNPFGVPEFCPTCHGKGAVVGLCPACNGYL